MKNFMFFLINALLISTISQAQINVNGNWTPLGNTSIVKVSNDPDGGDEVSDGAILIDGNTEEVGQGTIFTFGGKIESGKSYTVDTYIYNFGNSHVKLKVSLYNSTTNTLLATTSQIILQKEVEGKDYKSQIPISISYNAKLSDEGNLLQIRYIREDDGNNSRNFNIDNARLNGLTIPFFPKKIRRTN